VNTCLYCGKPIGPREQLSQLLFGDRWGIAAPLVPYVCSGWCGRQWSKKKHSMKLEPFEVAR
jgi:hypothetical protein